jgi:hypothetical protein
MKTAGLTLLILVTFTFACTHKLTNENNQPGIVRLDSFYGAIVADTIIYDVIIQNPNPEDQWTSECLKDFKHSDLIDSVFSLVYSGKLAAYDFFSKKSLAVNEIKSMESEDGYSRDKIGKIQFTERWYFDKPSQQLQKEVLSMVFGYELFNQERTLRGYKPIFKVYLKH